MPSDLLSLEEEAISIAFRRVREGHYEQGLNSLLGTFDWLYPKEAELTHKVIESYAYLGQAEYLTKFKEVLGEVIPLLRKELRKSTEGEAKLEQIGIFYALGQIYELQAVKCIAEDEDPGSALRSLRKGLAYFTLSGTIKHKEESAALEKRSLQQRIKALEFYLKAQEKKSKGDYQSYVSDLQEGLFGLIGQGREIGVYLLNDLFKTAEGCKPVFRKYLLEEFSFLNVVSNGTNPLRMLQLGLEKELGCLEKKYAKLKKTSEKSRSRDRKEEARKELPSLGRQVKEIAAELKNISLPLGLVNQVREGYAQAYIMGKSSLKIDDVIARTVEAKKELESLLPPSAGEAYLKLNEEVSELIAQVRVKKVKGEDHSEEIDNISVKAGELEQMVSSSSDAQKLRGITELVEELEVEIKYQQGAQASFTRGMEKISGLKRKLDEMVPEKIFLKNWKYAEIVARERSYVARKLREVSKLSKNKRYAKMHQALLELMNPYSPQIKHFCMGRIIELEDAIKKSKEPEKESIIRRISSSYRRIYEDLDGILKVESWSKHL